MIDHASTNLGRLVQRLDGRAAALRLLRGLGFPRAPEPLRAPGLPPTVRRLTRTVRLTLAAHLVELRREPDPELVRAVARSLRAVDGTRHHVLLVCDATWSRVALACDAPGAGVRSITLEPGALRASDLDVLAELEPAPDEGDSAAAMRILRALDRDRIGGRFFRDVVAVRDHVSRCWTGVPRRATAERDALALLLLSRLVFLYFLQRRGLLAGDAAYMPALLRSWLQSRRRGRGTFYRSRLRALFFGVLNRRPERRTTQARALGELPYLNGGLFELHALEARRPELDLADDVVACVFTELLERYRFTSTDASSDAADAGGVDPEMLGRIFEGLMPGERRERTGTFYTPAPLVGRVVTDTLALHFSATCGVDVGAVRTLLAKAGGGDALRECGGMLDEAAAARMREAAARVRVLDPACGSGAFLLGTLAALSALRDRTHATEVRREIVAHALHGVDLLEDAALICSLRLWLALVPQCDDVALVPPLPNLDRRIRQGDALLDPLDIGAAIAGRPLDSTAPPELRPLTARLRPLADRYLGAGPETKPALRAELDRLERDLARTWLATLEARLDREERELQARAGDRDLFGAPAAHAATAAKRLDAVRRRREELAAFTGDVGGRGRLPFFSFRVHFAEAQEGFDVVLSNPPWVRAHRWPPAVRRLLRERYRVCGDAGWPAAARLVGNPSAAGSQVDLSLLFLERCIALLRAGGTLGMLLPAKLFRSLYAGGARALLAGTMDIASIDDHSLDHRTIFDADAFTSVLIARRRETGDSAAGATTGAASVDAAHATPPHVRVTLRRRGREPLCFAIAADDLPLVPGDARAPWLLAPPGCRAALRAMQRNGAPIGERLVVRRGVMTGANEVLVVRDVAAKLGDLARIRTEGWHRAATAQGKRAYAAYVEASALRPALRGTDIQAWRARPGRHVLWTPHNDDASLTAPPRLTRFLRRHRGRLRQQDHELGALHRLGAHTLGHKVVWSDVAADLRAAAVPPTVRCATGSDTPVVPLNTVYYIATRDARESMILAAYLNSLPLRVFARAIAERAKDAHFRFFAWTIAALPLPYGWQEGSVAIRLYEIASAAHENGALRDHARRELDDLVTAAYGIDAAGRASLVAFDAWLAGPAADSRASSIETLQPGRT